MFEFEFKNLESEQISVQEYASYAVRRILEIAPYGASGLGYFERAGQEALVRFEIRSAGRLFVGVGAGSDFHEAIDRAEAHLEESIEKWQRSRFKAPAA